MINLNENTASQNVYLTLKESVKHFTTAYTDYLLQFTSITGKSYYMIGNVDADTDRYTKLIVGTDADNATGGSLILPEGEYNYKVYGQNSSTNLDPGDAVVVGVLEIGLAKVTSSTDYFTESTTTIAQDEVYGG